jgi:hypothetical protein
MVKEMTVKGRGGRKVIGTVRQRPGGKWIATGCSHGWDTIYAAMDYLTRMDESCQFQIKSALSHKYWTGKGWSKNRDNGKLYRTRGQANLVAPDLNDKYRNGSKSWDTIIVIEHVDDNWRN